MSTDRFEALDRLAPLFEAPEPTFDGFLRRRHRKRRNRRITAGVAGVAVVVALVWTVSPGVTSDRVGTADDPASTTVPPDVASTTVPADAERVGFVGLPPEGATPSAPESGELVASLWSHIRLDPVWGTGELYLYADGRVIWTRRDGRSLGEGANEHSTGFLEQRLTPEGIELVRSEILATGLFDSDSPPPDDADGSLRVGVQGEDGTWRVNAQESALDQEQSDALLQLAQRLRYLESWLPAGAWKHREITAYVPSRFALEVDVHTDTGEVLTDRASILSLLSPPVRELLSTATGSPVELGEGNPSVDVGPDVYRFDLATEQARALARALDDAGVEQVEHTNAYVLAYDVPVLGPIELVPYMPHGEPDCACTG